MAYWSSTYNDLRWGLGYLTPKMTRLALIQGARLMCNEHLTNSSRLATRIVSAAAGGCQLSAQARQDLWLLNQDSTSLSYACPWRAQRKRKSAGSLPSIPLGSIISWKRHISRGDRWLSVCVLLVELCHTCSQRGREASPLPSGCGASGGGGLLLREYYDECRWAVWLYKRCVR